VAAPGRITIMSFDRGLYGEVDNADDQQAGVGRVIYLDHQATTPIDPVVLEEMMPYLTDTFANAASHHGPGRQAAAAVERAREQIAALVDGRVAGVVFTSGATEANNLALRGLAESGGDRPRIVTVATEHPSVLETATSLASRGVPVEVLPVGSTGELDLDVLARTVDDETLVVSIMAANNEIGTLHPMSEIVEVVHRVGALVHCDATQLVGKIPLSIDQADIDLLSMSAHKLYGPKGVGALYLSREAARRVAPQMVGGGHERGHRSGTLNVAGSVGFGAAAATAAERMPDESPRLAELSQRLFSQIAAVGGISLNGPADERLPGNLNVCIEGTTGEDVMLRMPRVAASTGSACSSASPRPSHVLLAIGRSYGEAASAVRFGVGRFTSEDDVDIAAGAVVEAIAAARSDVAIASVRVPR